MSACLYRKIVLLDVTAVAPEYEAAESAAATVVGAIGPAAKLT